MAESQLAVTRLLQIETIRSWTLISCLEVPGNQSESRTGKFFIEILFLSLGLCL